MSVLRAALRDEAAFARVCETLPNCKNLYFVSFGMGSAAPDLVFRFHKLSFRVFFVWTGVAQLQGFVSCGFR